MDYEKKYKEALEKARQLCAYPTTKSFISDLQDLFPELAESEDEKVRKEIINYFRCQSEEEPTRKEIHNKWIAWLENIPYTIDHEEREGFHLGYRACLEKQNENSVRWNENTDDNKPKKHHSVLMKTIHGIAEGEWQGGKMVSIQMVKSIKR